LSLLDETHILGWLSTYSPAVNAQTLIWKPSAMIRPTNVSGLLLATLLAMLAGTAIAAPPPADQQRAKYVRLERTPAGEPLRLQTAITRFVPAGTDSDTVVVELVGAVHVGDADYYEALNKRFEGYEVVLYEMVAPEGAKIPRGTKPG
jgi:hypothetical protein